jgi:hypothetical protein
MTMTQRRRGSVLAGSNAEVADELRAHPGQWFLVAADNDPGRAHTFAQTAYRIRLNYADGKGLADFAEDETGRFNAVATTEPVTNGRVALCEIRAIWEPKSAGDAGLL